MMPPRIRRYVGICGKRHTSSEFRLARGRSLPEFLLHAVMGECEDIENRANNFRDDDMPRMAHLARRRRNAVPAVPDVIMQPAVDDTHVVPARVSGQILQRGPDQNLVSLAAQIAVHPATVREGFCQMTFSGLRQSNLQRQMLGRVAAAPLPGMRELIGSSAGPI